MPRLISGSTLRRGGSGEFLDLKGAMPQLPPNENTSTGYTIVTDSLYRTRYRSSLGNLEMNSGTIYSNLPDGMIRLYGTNSGFVHVTSSTISVSTTTGALVVNGGIGVGKGMFINDDINVNGINIGQGFEGLNNVIVRGTAAPQLNEDKTGQQSIAIGYDTLLGLTTSYKNIAIGRYALNSGTFVSNSIALGDSALRNIGTPPEYHISNITGITLTTPRSITTISNTNPVVITVNDHNFNTGDKIYVTGVEGMTTTIVVQGNTSTISLLNNNAYWVNVLTTNTIALYNNKLLTSSVNGTTYNPYISNGVITIPAKISVVKHGLSTGTRILVKGVEGVNSGSNSLVNDKEFFIDYINSTTLAIYSDNIITIPVTGYGYSSYVSSGSVFRPLLSDSNIAIGHNAGYSLIDGEQNFFFGDGIAKNLNTGSYNFFIGHEVGNNLTRGSANIAIGGDNLVDGKDNQVNIGSVFYYDGDGYLQLNADTGVGIGTIATATDYAAFAVYGGIGVTDNALIGGNVKILDTTESTGTNYGALTVQGGVGIVGNVHIGRKLVVTGNGDVNLSPFAANVVLSPSIAGTVIINPIDTTGLIDNMIIGSTNPKDSTFVNTVVSRLTATNTTTAISSTTGAVQILGGVGIIKDVHIGGLLKVYGGIDAVITTATNLIGGNTGSIPYQLSTGTTTLLPIGGNNQVLVSNGTTPVWTDLGIVQFETSTNTLNVFVNTTTTATYYIGLTDNINDFSPVRSINDLYFNNDTRVLSVNQIYVSSSTVSTSTTTGALVVEGGIATKGSVYSKDGNPDENYLLYTPQVTVSTSTPVYPRIGDFWIDPFLALQFQYIKDGTSTFWLQVAEI